MTKPMTSDSEELIDCENCPHNSSWHTGENFSVTPDSTKCSANKCKCSKFLAPKAQSEAPSVDELDLLVATMMHWQGFYDEAMQNLPEETRQFVETTSWAGELHQIEREKIAKAKINRLIVEARRQEVESLMYEAREHTITDIEMIQHQTRGKVDFIEAVETKYFAKRLVELSNNLSKGE